MQRMNQQMQERNDGDRQASKQVIERQIVMSCDDFSIPLLFAQLSAFYRDPTNLFAFYLSKKSQSASCDIFHPPTLA